MASKQEIAAQIADLNKQLESADDDDDVELLVEHDGTKATLKGKHARKFLQRLGLEDDAPTGDPADGDPSDPDGDPDGAPDDKPPDPHRYFRR